MPDTSDSSLTSAAQVMGGFDIDIQQVEDYEFRVRFDQPDQPELLIDAPPGVGKGAVASPSRLLAAAMGHCLASGLLFCARRARLALGPIHATVHTQLVRNEKGYPRVGKVDVVIETQAPEGAEAQAAHCAEVFENVCMVAESVRQGIDVSVRVNGLA